MSKSDIIKSMLVTVNETNKVANDTIDKLNCQSEQFNNIQNNLKETNISLSRSSKTISSLKSTFGLSFSSQQNDKFILPKNKKQKSNDVVSHQQDIIDAMVRGCHCIIVSTYHCHCDCVEHFCLSFFRPSIRPRCIQSTSSVLLLA